MHLYLLPLELTLHLSLKQVKFASAFAVATATQDVLH